MIPGLLDVSAGVVLAGSAAVYTRTFTQWKCSARSGDKMKQAMKQAAPQLAGILLITLCLCVLPARAQLASYVDARGNLVFINADPPANRRGSPKTAKPAPAAQSGTASGAGSADRVTGASRSSQASSQAVSQASQGASPASPTLGTTEPPPGRANLIPVAMEPAALDQVVHESAEKNHVDPALVRAVISTESNWNSSAVSSKGALGLMQLIPGTAERLGVGNAFDPAQNVAAGTRYLGMLLQRYDGDVSKALAAYNAGPGAVDRFGGVPDYRETRNYVEKVTSTYFGPASERRPRALAMPRPIYRALDSNGRVVFSNE